MAMVIDFGIQITRTNMALSMLADGLSVEEIKSKTCFSKQIIDTMRRELLPLELEMREREKKSGRKLFAKDGMSERYSGLTPIQKKQFNKVSN